MKITLDGVEYASKSAVKKRASELLRAVGPVAETHYGFLLALLNRHPDATQKIGCGVASFDVRVNRPFPTQGFWIRRRDGSETDFSYLECLSPSNARRKVHSALRRLVVDQVLDAKRAAFAAGEVRCPVTDDVLGEDCHIDHEPPWTFEAIADAFIADNGGSADAIALEPTADGSLEDRLVDRELAERFRDYHAKVAVLRPLSRRANLSLLRRRQS